MIKNKEKFWEISLDSIEIQKLVFNIEEKETIKEVYKIFKKWNKAVKLLRVILAWKEEKDTERDN